RSGSLSKASHTDPPLPPRLQAPHIADRRSETVNFLQPKADTIRCDCYKRQNRHTLPRLLSPLDRYNQHRKLFSSERLRRCSQVAKAADCKSAIVGSTPTSASGLFRPA